MHQPRKGECAYRKSPWRFLFGAAAFVSGGWLVLYGALQWYGTRLLEGLDSAREAATIGIIGGADGPTAIFVTGKVSSGFPDWDVILAAAILIVSILTYLRLCRCKKK